MSEVGLEEKEDLSPLKDLLYPWYFSPVTPAHPFVYKRDDRAPYEERDRTNRLSMDNSHTDELIEHSVPHTHTAKSPLGPWHPFVPSIRDLGPIPLSTVCTPYYEPYLVLIIQAAAADWT